MTVNYDFGKQKLYCITKYVTPCLKPDIYLIVMNNFLTLFFSSLQVLLIISKRL